MSELGRLQRKFGNESQLFVLGFGAVLVAFGGLALASWRGAFGPELKPALPGALAFYAACVVAGLAVIGYEVNTFLRGARLHEGGVELRRGWRRTAVAWGDIRVATGAIAVRLNGVPAHAGLPLRLGLADGRTVTVSADLLDFAALADRIHDETLSRLLPKAEKALSKGKRREFGPFAVGPDGVTFDGETLPWREFGGVSFPWGGRARQPADDICLHVGQGTVVWATARIQDVPNGNLFVTLLRAGGRAAGGDPDVVAAASPNLTLPPAAAPRPRKRAKSPAADASGVTPSEHPMSVWSLAQTADDTAKFLIPALLFGAIGLTICAGVFLFRGLQTDVRVGYAAAGIVAAVAALYAASAFRPRLVAVSDAGIEWTGRGPTLGSVTRTRRWDEVREVYCALADRVMSVADAPNPALRSSELRIVFDDRTQLKLNEAWADIARLIATVQRATTDVILPVARAELAEGGATFGPIVLTTKGLVAGGKVLAWDRIDKAWIGDGRLGWTSDRAKPTEHLLSTLPNYPTLLTLLGEQLGDRFEGPTFR